MTAPEHPAGCVGAWCSAALQHYYSPTTHSCPQNPCMRLADRDVAHGGVGLWISLFCSQGERFGGSPGTLGIPVHFQVGSAAFWSSHPHDTRHGAGSGGMACSPQPAWSTGLWLLKVPRAPIHQGRGREWLQGVRQGDACASYPCLRAL